MSRYQDSNSTPRSPLGFALALSLALLTYWGAGQLVQVLELHDAPMQAAASQAQSDEP
jgi:hypothetical protein